MPGKRFVIEVQPRIPEELSRLEELSENLMYSWDRTVRGLFFRLDRDLWEQTGHNPRLFLRRIDQQKLEDAAQDPVYMQDYARIVSSYDNYLYGTRGVPLNHYLDPQKDLVAYSCAEFGLHESLPIYSGGLGILAGDHCKACSDMGLPFVAVGMLYRQGYFNQRIDANGNQIAIYVPSNFLDLPVSPVMEEGEEVKIAFNIPSRTIHLKVWEAKVGHVSLYLLDSDLPENAEDDRRITYQLYGGDSTNRLLQEMVLGVGGPRVLHRLGLTPTVWHINEGHAAFQIIERCRDLVVNQGLPFAAALEAVAAQTVFTTHTPVPAGHDIFDHRLMSHYFSETARELGVSMQELLELGKSPVNEHGFNMTALALRGSRFHNGVSRIHGRVSSEMERYVWPQIDPTENPIRYVTNGVHVPTFLANEWANYFDLHFGGGWRFELLNEEYWKRIDELPNHGFWSVRQSLKTKMLETVYDRAVYQYRRNGFSESQIKRLTSQIKPRQTDILTIGFARRFATYKRAALIMSDLERLKRLLGDPARPVVLIFAGKAHPHDHPGQDVIRRITEIAKSPDFEGKIVLLEDYDIALARKMVMGVDVWLNNPAYPLEASGTSGQKAAINGVLNLSVLDGWWDEGYNGSNGWAITPHGDQFSDEFRDKEEANELLDTLEQSVIPLYYERDGHGYSSRWIDMCKSAMRALIPQFNAQRMVLDYLKGFYQVAARQGKQFHDNNYQQARELSEWKHKVKAQWPQVRMQRLDDAPAKIYKDEPFRIRIAMELAGLEPDDVIVDCLVGTEDYQGEFNRTGCQSLTFTEQLEDGRALFELELAPQHAGRQCYMIRAYPHHPLLSQRFEVGLMIWL